MNNEQAYYEQDCLWNSETYLESETERRRFEACANLVPRSANSLLDVGTGNGAFLAFLERPSRGIALHGLERSAAAASNATCAATIEIGSCDALPFAPRSFDVVSALEVLEHLPFGVYSATLKEMQRVAATSILVCMPYRQTRTLVRCQFCGCMFNLFYHLRSYSESSLERLFTQFRLVEQTLVRAPNEEWVWPLEPLRQLKARYRPHGCAGADLCPQCGFFSQPSAEGAPRESRLKRAFSGRLRRTRQRVRWIACLYERVTDDA